MCTTPGNTCELNAWKLKRTHTLTDTSKYNHVCLSAYAWDVYKLQLYVIASHCNRMQFFFNFVYFPHWLWLRLRIQAPPSLGLTMGMCECAGSYGYGSMAMHHKKVNVLKRLKNSNFVDFCAFFCTELQKREYFAF